MALSEPESIHCVQDQKNKIHGEWLDSLDLLVHLTSVYTFPRNPFNTATVTDGFI